LGTQIQSHSFRDVLFWIEGSL